MFARRFALLAGTLLLLSVTVVGTKTHQQPYAMTIALQQGYLPMAFYRFISKRGRRSGIPMEVTQHTL